ncbi:hypothetical protein FQN53_006329 [Emmonsiellopsis sp. PD_33]|nr:hypothetical protein FQN53_006329 [Emmonsiellopsis sp. PD_33]
MTRPIRLQSSLPSLPPPLPSDVLAAATATPTPISLPEGDKRTASSPIDTSAESDYGSDFSSDEEVLLNALLARIGTENDGRREQVVAVDDTGVEVGAAKQNQNADEDEDEDAGGESFVTAALAPAPAPAPAVEVVDEGSLRSLGLESAESAALDGSLVIDIEDYYYDGISAVRAPKVLGVEKWRPFAQRSWAGRGNRWGNGSGSGRGGEKRGGGWSAEHPDSREGREVERRRELERVRGQQVGGSVSVAAPGEEKGSASTNTKMNVSLKPDMRSPLDRFRRFPRKPLSVTDLVSPAWCELQYWYTLTKFGRKRATPEMKRGTVVHKELEDQVHTTVPIEVMTKEDGWALRIWNVIQGLRTLRVTGMTRELEVWGMVDGEIVVGIIDQLSYDCPDPELDASAEEHYADLRASKSLLPEYQTSLTEYFLSPVGGGRRLSDLDVGSVASKEASSGEPSTPKKRVYITDIKTRGKTRQYLPAVGSTAFRPTHLQLQLYYHFLSRLITSDDVSLDAIAARYKLQTEKRFSDSFIAQIGSLNEEFFDASQDLEADYIPPGSTGDGHFPTSQDSMTIILEHNSLSSLWKLMKSQLRLTFLPRNQNSQNTTTAPSPSNQPTNKSQSSNSEQSQDILNRTLLSPLLTATYISQPTSPKPDQRMEYMGSRSFLFNPSFLYGYLADEMRFWRGERQARGVGMLEAWKCRLCEFSEECEWRKEMEGQLAKNKRRRREAELVGKAGPGGGGNEGCEDVAKEEVGTQSVV